MHTRLQAAVTFVWAHYLRHGGSGQKLCKNKFATVYCRLSQSLKNVFRMVSMWPIQIKGSVSNSWETVNFFMTLWKCCTQGFFCQTLKKKSTTTIYSEKPKSIKLFQVFANICWAQSFHLFFISSLFIQTSSLSKLCGWGGIWIYFFLHIHRWSYFRRDKGLNLHFVLFVTENRRSWSWRRNWRWRNSRSWRSWIIFFRFLGVFTNSCWFNTFRISPVL